MSVAGPRLDGKIIEEEDLCHGPSASTVRRGCSEFVFFYQVKMIQSFVEKCGSFWNLFFKSNYLLDKKWQMHAYMNLRKYGFKGGSFLQAASVGTKAVSLQIIYAHTIPNSIFTYM